MSEIWLNCVGKGWAKLVAPLIERARRDDVRITQIKEKFGGLRFYTGPASQEFYDEIDKAESASLATCEMCGEAGNMRNDKGWIKTRCNACADRDILNLDAAS